MSVLLQEEQRKVSNMNDCLDAWAELMRTAAQQQGGQLKSVATNQSLPSSQGFPGLPTQHRVHQHWRLQQCCLQSVPGDG